MPANSISTQTRARELLLRLAVLLSLWWVLDEGRADGWWFGAIIIACALALSFAAPFARAPFRWSITGAARFIPYFLYESIRGGWDVARRAFGGTIRVEPSMLTYATHLRQPTARVFFAHVISLLPGTLSTDLREGEVTIHALAGTEAEIRAGTRALEARIAQLFHEEGAAS
jgi:multicomponent Na+:H+ antiporter subunit E